MSSVIIVKDLSTITGPVGYGKYLGQCAALVQHFGCHMTKTWKAGAIVKGNPGIKSGTCIATFKKGKYPNSDHGNHAAIYLGQDGNGIFVFDQWVGKDPGKRHIKFKNGMGDPSNNGNCFSVIRTPVNPKAKGFKYATVSGNPMTQSDSALVLKYIKDISVRNKVTKCLADEILTYNDVVEIIKSTNDKDGKEVYTRREILDLLIILTNARTLDDKSRMILAEFIIKHSH